MRRTRCLAVLTLLTLACAFGRAAPPATQPAAATQPTTRPATWAVPMPHKPGLPNLNRVMPNLYRGAQPSVEGMKELEKMGINTVVNLRAVHSDREELAGTKLAYVHIAETPYHAEDDDVVRFLKVVTDPARQPVFVHCQAGADRTGTMLAAYRLAVQGWTKDQAIDEMVHGGYGFHPLWQNLIRYVRELDVEKVRRQAGVATPVTQPSSEFKL